MFIFYRLRCCSTWRKIVTWGLAIFHIWCLSRHRLPRASNRVCLFCRSRCAVDMYTCSWHVKLIFRPALTSSRRRLQFIILWNIVELKNCALRGITLPKDSTASRLLNKVKPCLGGVTSWLGDKNWSTPCSNYLFSSFFGLPFVKWYQTVELLVLFKVSFCVYRQVFDMTPDIFLAVS